MHELSQILEQHPPGPNTFNRPVNFVIGVRGSHSWFTSVAKYYEYVYNKLKRPTLALYSEYSKIPLLVIHTFPIMAVT